MKKAFRMLVVFILILTDLQYANADEFFSSSEYFAYFNVENKGLLEMDLETGEALLYNKYADIVSIAVAPDGDLILNLRYEVIKTDLYKTEDTIFEVEDKNEAWIYHMKIFDDKIYVAMTNGSIYSMQLDGTECKLLADDAYLHDFVVCDTYLYYCDGTALYRIDVQRELSAPQMLVDDIVTAVEVYDGIIYFICGTDRALCSYKESIERVCSIPEGIRDFALLSGGEKVAVVMRRDSSLKVFDIATGEECATVTDACVDIAADENGFYYKQMAEGIGFYDIAEYSVFMVNDNYTSILIGDE